jgi:SpoVK/Ycf46/Vps4 family AAA+-type ATPase
MNPYNINNTHNSATNNATNNVTNNATNNSTNNSTNYHNKKRKYYNKKQKYHNKKFIDPPMNHQQPQNIVPEHPPYLPTSNNINPYYDPYYNPYYNVYYDPYYNLYYDPYYNLYYDPYYNPNFKPEFKSEFKSESKPEFKPEFKPESKPDFKPESELPPLSFFIKPKKNIDFKDIKIDCLEDLVKLIDNNIYDSQYEYNIDLEGLTKIKDDLIQLINMIGLKKLKKSIFEQILYFIQKLQSDDFKHTVLYGPPGTGKTEVAKILGRIYSKIGILSKNIFKKVSRSDLVAGYLGQTAIKTKDVIKQCLGGVLFIDEAYSLGTVSKSDSFSRECIDTICHESSEHKKDLIIMIAGYENELKESFFELNKGLDSRFIWRFEFEPYSAHELLEIFLLKIKESNWTINIDSKELQKWFETNINSFKFFGRDIEVLFLKTKIAHSRRIFGLDKEFIKKINISDLNNGYILFKESIKEKNNIISSMYC